MVETANGMFEIIKDDNNSFNIADFDKKFVEIFKRYEFIVGDYFQDMLRLKGFNHEDIHKIPDYINEYCALSSNYYILRNPSFDSKYEVSEE